MTKLPDIRPEQIRYARNLKRLLTGYLNSAVSTYPPFKWDESVLLRAQIARITSTTVLAPSGWFSQEEDDAGETIIAPSEEIEPVPMPDPEDLDGWFANWVHRRASENITVTCSVPGHLLSSASKL
jgi:radial spoke head protein 4/6